MSLSYITKLSPNVSQEHIHFNNRYGIKIAADLYAPRDRGAGKYPALIVGAPYGGVKEQRPVVYANELAQRGFVVLTFDQVYMGESSGYPRHISSPELFAESFSASIDYLGIQVPFVDRERIDVIGICGSAGFVLSAAAVDPRIKAIATASMYDITDVRGMMKLSKNQLDKMKVQIAKQRWVDFANGQPEYKPTFPDQPYPTVTQMNPVDNEWFRFYAIPRGFHPNSRGGFTTTSNLAMMQFSALDYIKEITPRPILYIFGDKAHSRAFSERAYDLATGPRKSTLLMIASILTSMTGLIRFRLINSRTSLPRTCTKVLHQVVPSFPGVAGV